MKYNTQHAYAPRAQYETHGKPSMTVPGEAKTIKELLARALQGVENPERDANYLDVEDIGQINQFFAIGSLDLTDLETLQQRNKDLGATIEKGLKAKAQAKAEAEAKAEAKRKEREAALDALTDKDKKAED